MKYFLIFALVILSVNCFALPTISYPTEGYQHSSDKLSGLKDAGSMVTKERIINHMEMRDVVGQFGEDVSIDLVIDDPDLVKEIEFVKCVTSNDEPFKIVFSDLKVSEPVLSKKVSINLTMPEKTTIIEYTLKVNGLDIRLPIALIVK